MYFWKVSISLLWIVSGIVVLCHFVWMLFGVTTPTASGGLGKVFGDLLFLSSGSVNSAATILAALYASKSENWKRLLISLAAIIILGILFALYNGLHGFSFWFWSFFGLNTSLAGSLILFYLRRLTVR